MHIWIIFVWMFCTKFFFFLPFFFVMMLGYMMTLQYPCLISNKMHDNLEPFVPFFSFLPVHHFCFKNGAETILHFTPISEGHLPDSWSHYKHPTGKTCHFIKYEAASQSSVDCFCLHWITEMHCPCCLLNKMFPFLISHWQTWFFFFSLTAT